MLLVLVYLRHGCKVTLSMKARITGMTLFILEIGFNFIKNKVHTRTRY